MKRAQGSFSSRSGARWSRSGTDTRKRREATILDNTPAGEFGRISPLSEVAVRTAIEAQTCPWCGHGPYRNISLHTNLAHGVSAAELRRMAGYSSHTSICSPELSNKFRDNLTNRPDREMITRRAADAARRAGTGKVAGQAWRRRSEQETRERDGLIVDMYHEGILFEVIADATGVNTRSIPRILRKRGINVDDGRGRRFNDPQVRATALEGLQKGAAKRAHVASEIEKVRLRRYEELGSDWNAIGQCALEWGVSRKTATAYLKEHGAHVPDGRIVSPNRVSNLPPRPTVVRERKPVNS